MSQTKPRGQMLRVPPAPGREGQGAFSATAKSNGYSTKCPLDSRLWSLHASPSSRKGIKAAPSPPGQPTKQERTLFGPLDVLAAEHIPCLSFSGLKTLRPGSIEKGQWCPGQKPRLLITISLRAPELRVVVVVGVRPPGLGIRGTVCYPDVCVWGGPKASHVVKAGSDYRSLGLAGLGPLSP